MKNILNNGNYQPPKANLVVNQSISGGRVCPGVMPAHVVVLSQYYLKTTSFPLPIMTIEKEIN